MDRSTYMRALYDALSELVHGQERAEILRYYEEYFDDAGPEGETAVIRGLGDPQELARKLAAEAGYDTAAKPKKRREWSLAALGIIAVLAVMIVALAALFVVGGEVVNNPGQEPTSVVDNPGQTPTSTEPLEDIIPRGTVSISGEAFYKIEIGAPVANVTIQTGEDFSVELEWLDDGQYTLNYSLSQSVLRITGSPNSVSGHTDTRVFITVPEGTALNEIDIEVGLGDVTVVNITTTDFYCDTGLGDMIWRGSLARDTEMNTGMGDIAIIADAIDGWECELSTGMGEVRVDGTAVERSFRQEGRSGSLTATTGMGDVTLAMNSKE